MSNPKKVRALIVPAYQYQPMRVETIPANLHGITMAIDAQYIEAVSGWDGHEQEWHVYVDEEGKLNQKPENARATILARQLGARFLPGDYLSGDAVFMSSTPEGEEADVPIYVVNAAAHLQPVMGS